MDLIPNKFIEEMRKTGRGHLHEVRSMADELLKRRKGEKDKEEESPVFKIAVSRERVLNGPWESSSAISYLRTGDIELVKFSLSSKTIHCVVYRVR